jgi:mannose-6-phosphate isomerase-like protein (cupin superfamily)
MQKNYLLTFVFILGVAFLVGSCQSGTKEHSAESAEQSSINYNEDLGGEPWVLDIEEATLGNENYRAANWTGKYMQLVFMTLKPGEVIDLEIHSGHDQFIRIEEGEARVQMGKTEDNLSFDKKVSDDWAILIPAGYWHTVENTGKSALKLYTLYGPAEHEKGTINKTYEEAKEAHHDHSH